MTVVELKGVIRDIGSVCRTKLAVSGTKPSLVNRITDQIKSWAKSSSWNNVRSALRLIDAPRDNKGNLLASNGPLSASGGAQQNTWDSGGTQRQVGDASAYNGAHNGFYQTNYSHGNGASRSSEGGVRVGYHKLKNNSASVRMGNSGYVGQSSPHAGSRFATGKHLAACLVLLHFRSKKTFVHCRFSRYTFSNQIGLPTFSLLADRKVSYCTHYSARGRSPDT